VHALGQVASVSLETPHDAGSIQRALNFRLPADIRVIAADDERVGFHARSNATGKTYRYRIVTTPVLSPFGRWFVWHAPEARDVDAMRRAAVVLVGQHDFASFQARGTTITDTTRTIQRLEILTTAGELVVEVDGDGFLRHMVRAIVGTLVECGSGARKPERMGEVLAARDRQAAGATAPACGLTLVSVRY